MADLPGGDLLGKIPGMDMVQGMVGKIPGMDMVKGIIPGMGGGKGGGGGGGDPISGLMGQATSALSGLTDKIPGMGGGGGGGGMPGGGGGMPGADLLSKGPAAITSMADKALGPIKDMGKGLMDAVSSVTSAVTSVAEMATPGEGEKKKGPRM